MVARSQLLNECDFFKQLAGLEPSNHLVASQQHGEQPVAAEPDPSRPQQDVSATIHRVRFEIRSTAEVLVSIHELNSQSVLK